MIQTEGSYRSTLEALCQLEQALAAMSRRKADYGPHFADFAEPVVDHILRFAPKSMPTPACPNSSLPMARRPTSCRPVRRLRPRMGRPSKE